MRLASQLRVRPLFVVVLLLPVFGGGFLLGQRAPDAISRRPPPDVGPTLEPFWETWNLVRRNYVCRDEARPDELTRGAIRGMLESLGDTGHTRLLTPAEYARFQEATNGRWDGIGVRLTVHRRRAQVAEIFGGSPAQAAGLRVGDVLSTVDGTAVRGLSVSGMLDCIRDGPAGSTVRLQVLRAGEDQPREFLIARQPVHVPSVAGQRIAGMPVLHMAIRQFDRRTHALFRETVREARQGGCRGIVLDLRGCPGGLTEAAFAVADDLLAGGVIGVARDNQGNQHPTLVRPGGDLTDLAMTVLVDEGTASAAEILAGALQDHRRARVVGTRTYGAGTGLQSFVLCDGSVVLLGVVEWLTPHGRRIWRAGIQPDVEAELPDGINPLWPVASGPRTATSVARSRDTQLQKALEVIRGELGPAPPGRRAKAP